MICLRRDLVEMLHSMARQVEKPSVMLQAIVAELGAETADRPLLVRYFSTAFCFTEGQAYKIFGWFPDGSGALQDSGIDNLLSHRIQETRSEWDKPDAGPPGLDSFSVQEDIQLS
jgi:hypothetical protein